MNLLMKHLYVEAMAEEQPALAARKEQLRLGKRIEIAAHSVARGMLDMERVA